MSKKAHATKKVFLSLAVIAASGGYVAFENASPQANREIGLVDSDNSLVSKPATPPPTLGLGARGAESPRVSALSKPPQADMTDRSIGNAPTAPVPVRPAADLGNLRGPSDTGQPQQQDNITQLVATATLPAHPPPPDPRPAHASTVTSSIQVAHAGFQNGTFRGPSENAYYGRVKLAAVIKSGKIQRIHVLNHPNDFRRSRYINSIALPMLEQEAVRAQSANIDIVSGATLTSVAYIRSLSAALSAAKG